jgi:hypothetical protein
MVWSVTRRTEEGDLVKEKVTMKQGSLVIKRTSINWFKKLIIQILVRTKFINKLGKIFTRSSSIDLTRVLTIWSI